MHRPVLHFTGQDGDHQPLPFHPAARYQELGFLPADLAPGKRVYAGVRELLRALGYDAARFGTAEWSPLGDLVRPGVSVLRKPNFDSDEARARRSGRIRIPGARAAHAAQLPPFSPG